MPPRQSQTADSYVNTIVKRQYIRLAMTVVLGVVGIATIWVISVDPLVRIGVSIVFGAGGVIVIQRIIRRLSRARYGMRVERHARRILDSEAPPTWIVRHDVSLSSYGNIDHVLIHATCPVVVVIETKAFHTDRQDTHYRRQRMVQAAQQVGTHADILRNQLRRIHPSTMIVHVVPVVWLPVAHASDWAAVDRVAIVVGPHIVRSLTDICQNLLHPHAQWELIRERLTLRG